MCPTNCAWNGRKSQAIAANARQEAGHRGQRAAAVDWSIRSTTGRETPSSACTRRPDEINGLILLEKLIGASPINQRRAVADGGKRRQRRRGRRGRGGREL
ncbi:charged multivesicular body protein 1 [Dorcoceras hygrometricum]|uniref:Charged multivesicular body protein 1 n=1 Tax=Dorcoceras hygrometricum TaxID=472368 RepID=A0A2Z7CQ02_9LAMI|nr:charged multivesicular body protein 1 [Dorcoceras hygrometricum]